MSAVLKLDTIRTHVVDILGNIKGRDQPIMKMDRAVDLVRCLEPSVLNSSSHIFFDPFCKAGEILLATALLSVLNKAKRSVVSQEKVAEELYSSNRFFALAPDERHYYLSKRTFYGNENSHNKDISHCIRNGNYLSEIDGKLNEDTFKKELLSMLSYINKTSPNKRIIALGNPPYQEEDSGHGRSAKPIYNTLIETLIDSGCIEQFVFVIPSRWFSGGKGLNGFQKKND